MAEFEKHLNAVKYLATDTLLLTRDPREALKAVLTCLAAAERVVIAVKAERLLTKGIKLSLDQAYAANAVDGAVEHYETVKELTEWPKLLTIDKEAAKRPYHK